MRIPGSASEVPNFVCASTGDLRRIQSIGTAGDFQHGFRYVSVQWRDLRDRRDAVLKNMAEEGYISDSARDDALNDDLQNHIKVGVSDSADESSYFTDYAID